MFQRPLVPAAFRNRVPSTWDRWTPLGPLGINVDARRLENLSGSRLIHFLGEPKPWDSVYNVLPHSRGKGVHSTLPMNALQGHAPGTSTISTAHARRSRTSKVMPAVAAYRTICANVLGLQ